MKNPNFDCLQLSSVLQLSSPYKNHKYQIPIRKEFRLSEKISETLPPMGLMMRFRQNLQGLAASPGFWCNLSRIARSKNVAARSLNLLTRFTRHLDAVWALESGAQESGACDRMPVLPRNDRNIAGTTLFLPQNS